MIKKAKGEENFNKATSSKKGVAKKDTRSEFTKNYHRGTGVSIKHPYLMGTAMTLATGAGAYAATKDPAYTGASMAGAMLGSYLGFLGNKKLHEMTAKQAAIKIPGKAILRNTDDFLRAANRIKPLSNDPNNSLEPTTPSA